MPLFCQDNWPRKFLSFICRRDLSEPGESDNCIYVQKTETKRKCDTKTKLSSQTNWKHKCVVSLLLTHCGLQLFLPYSHSITQVFL